MCKMENKIIKMCFLTNYSPLIKFFIFKSVKYVIPIFFLILSPIIYMHKNIYFSKQIFIIPVKIYGVAIGMRYTHARCEFN